MFFTRQSPISGWSWSVQSWVVFIFECILLNHFTWVPNLAVGSGEK
jgi:hypothetical protein